MRKFTLTLTDGEGVVLGSYGIDLDDTLVEKIKGRLGPHALEEAARDVRLDMRLEAEDVARDIAAIIRQSN